MSQFNFDQQLSDALKLDSTINLNSSMSRMSIKPAPPRLNISGLNRSRSASRISPSLLSSKPKTMFNRNKSPARSKTPTRLGVNEIYNKKSQNGADRFIPNRSTTDMEYASHSMVNSEEDTDNLSTTQLERRRLLEENLNVGNVTDSRILSFKSKAPAAKDGYSNNMKILYSAGKPQAPKASNTRQVPSTAEKILDAPDMMNDFYLHLIDWSSLNHMAVALNGGLYIWNATDGSILQLFEKENEEEYICSVSWIKEGNVLGVGDSEGSVQLWDLANNKIIRTMRGHSGRVATLDWNQHTLASGGREGEIHLHDVRVAEHHVATLQAHSQEVCGLKWSPDGKFLASGGNDNTVHLWDPAAPRPINSITEHQSAVKAMSWCPWQRGVLATAGGTVDRTLRIWNTANMRQLHSIDTGSQVSSIVWNEQYKELATGHGFSQNQLTLWKYPSLAKVADLPGHTSRVLLLVCSPDGSTVASVAADETIRLWNVWPQQEKVKKSKAVRSHSSLLAQSIR